MKTNNKKELKVVVRDIRKKIPKDEMKEHEKDFMRLKVKEIKREKDAPKEVKEETEENLLFVYEEKPKIPRATPKREVTKLNVFCGRWSKINFSDHQCEICQKYFSSKYNLKIHTDRHYKPSYDCKECRRSFVSSFDLKRHSCIKDLTCAQCGTFFKKRGTLQKHMRCIHKIQMNTEGYSCDKCGKLFAIKGYLKCHLQKCSKEGEKSFSCDQCERTFADKYSIRQHVQSHAIYDVECKLCNQKVRPISIKDHMIRNHPKKGDEVQCKVCLKTFPGKTLLTQHLKIHDKKFQCNICDLKFENKSRHKIHMKFHENPEMFRCKICQKQLTSKQYLRLHMKTHDKDRVKHLNCNRCDFKTDNKTTLNGHLNHHLKLDEKLKNSTGIKCKKCPSILKNKNILSMHVKYSHGNLEKFQCDHCEHLARYKSDLKNHLTRKHFKSSKK